MNSLLPTSVIVSLLVAGVVVVPSLGVWPLLAVAATIYAVHVVVRR